MADKKSTSRIINEMGEIMSGLDRCGVPTAKELEKFIRSAGEKTKQLKSFNENKVDKSQTSE